MEIVVYTMVGCSHCTTVKQLFQRAKVEYIEKVINKDITVADLNEVYPNVRSFPFVVIDNKQIGGLMETAKLFLEEGLVSAPKRKFV